MRKVATERIGLRTARARLAERRTTVSFYAFDGSFCLMLEADTVEDARYLCHDVRLEFIGLCTK